MRTRIRSRGRLEEYLELDENQKEWFDKTGDAAAEGGDFLPFQTTEYYLKAALSAEPAGRSAILRQIVPDSAEFEYRSFELADPLGESRFSPCPRFVHRYPDRALILVTDECAMFCRHCFRRSFAGGMKGPLTDRELDPILEYLGKNESVSEILLTGGDPLTLSDSRLGRIIGRVKACRPSMIIRICSRMPVVLPSRLSPELAEMLGKYDGIWLVTHFNHASEFTPEASSAIRIIRKAGVPILNQTVLLRGVNDDVGALRTLFRTLLAGGVKPYYLFQGDLARGTSHLRVPLSEALVLTAELKHELSGMAMPRYAVDLPGGGGKITLPSQCDHIERRDDYYVIKGLDDEEYRYPAD